MSSPSGMVLDDLDLVGLAQITEDLDGLCAAQHLALQGQVALDDLVHALLDGLQVIGSEGLVSGEVVVEAVLDGRADGDLGARVQLLHRLGHHNAALASPGPISQLLAWAASWRRRAPLPLDAEQTADLVELLKEPPAGEEAVLLDLLTHRVPPGVDEAAYVKASFLCRRRQGRGQSPLIDGRATKLLGTMLGGYNIRR
jgi:hypothetical protein